MSADPERQVIGADDVNRAIRRAAHLVMGTVVITAGLVVGALLNADNWFGRLAIPAWLVLWALFLLWQARK